MMINLNHVDYNPHRDFKAYPIDETQVDALIDSIKQTGFWDNILVRPNPKNPERYQLAYGHHRLEAALACNVTLVDAPCRELSDDDMLHIMIKENATQAGGQSLSATLDSVKATLRRLSYLILSNDYETFSRILPKVCETEQSFISVKQRILAGKGLGKGVINSFDNAIPITSIEVAINTLKADGSFKEILEETQAKIDSEQAESERLVKAQEEELERIEKERLLQAEKALKEKELLDQQEQEARRIKDENSANAAKAKLDRLMQQMEDEQIRQVQLKESEQAKQARLKEQSIQKAKSSEDAAKAVNNAPTKVIDTGLSKYFSNSHQLATFIKVVQSETSKRFIPMDQHEIIAKQLVDEATQNNIKHITAQYITDFVNAITAKALGIEKKQTSKEKLAEQKNDARSLMESSVKTTRDSISRMNTAMGTILSVFERFPEMVTSNTVQGTILVYKNHISEAQDFINKLEKINTGEV